MSLWGVMIAATQHDCLDNISLIEALLFSKTVKRIQIAYVEP